MLLSLDLLDRGSVDTARRQKSKKRYNIFNLCLAFAWGRDFSITKLSKTTKCKMSRLIKIAKVMWDFDLDAAVIQHV